MVCPSMTQNLEECGVADEDITHVAASLLLLRELSDRVHFSYSHVTDIISTTE